MRHNSVSSSSDGQRGATVMEVIVFAVAIVMALGGVILYLEKSATIGVSRAKSAHETYQPAPPRGWPAAGGVTGGPYGPGGPLGAGGAYGPAGSAPPDTYPAPKTSPGGTTTTGPGVPIPVSSGIPVN